MMNHDPTLTVQAYFTLNGFESHPFQTCGPGTLRVAVVLTRGSLVSGVAPSR
jgi:hypothetical protein